MKVLDVLYDRPGQFSSESLKIVRVDRGIFMVRFQYDAGTGKDDIWIKPGESNRGYSFSLDEAKKYDRAAKRIEPKG
jgi:hypothetical protein